jgi:hypothetical protein
LTDFTHATGELSRGIFHLMTFLAGCDKIPVVVIPNARLLRVRDLLFAPKQEKTRFIARRARDGE